MSLFCLKLLMVPVWLTIMVQIHMKWPKRSYAMCTTAPLWSLLFQLLLMLFQLYCPLCCQSEIRAMNPPLGLALIDPCWKQVESFPRTITWLAPSHGQVFSQMYLLREAFPKDPTENFPPCYFFLHNTFCHLTYVLLVNLFILAYLPSPGYRLHMRRNFVHRCYLQHPDQRPTNHCWLNKWMLWPLNFCIFYLAFHTSSSQSTGVSGVSRNKKPIQT